MLKFQATHESSAKTGNLCGIQRKVLILGHLNGYRLEVAKPGGTAEHTSAWPQSAEHLGFITHPYLPELDSGTENACQILDQLTEIDSSFSGEIKDDLVAVKRKFHIHELHFEAMIADFI
ncbi:hypothetical protein D3C74_366430 [compost metagenome]